MWFRTVQCPAINAGPDVSSAKQQCARNEICVELLMPFV